MIDLENLTPELAMHGILTSGPVHQMIKKYLEKKLTEATDENEIVNISSILAFYHFFIPMIEIASEEQTDLNEEIDALKKTIETKTKSFNLMQKEFDDLADDYDELHEDYSEKANLVVNLRTVIKNHEKTIKDLKDWDIDQNKTINIFMDETLSLLQELELLKTKEIIVDEELIDALYPQPVPNQWDY